MRLIVSIVVVIALATIGGMARSLPASSQQTCRATAPAPSREPNIFTEAQENDLGDAVAERIGREFRVIDDDTVAGHLRAIGDRLVQHLPPTSLHLHFDLVELPEANAFVLPGGRVYVSRKLIALTQSEDELAGVLGHEIGHLIARQQTIATTKQFKEVLGVTHVGDRKDIFAKYHQLMDNAAKKPEAFRQSTSHEGQDQIAADQLGLFAVRAAGYDPSAQGQFFDRFSGTKGDTGSFFSNLFGTTSPESKRLREMVRAATAMPPGCTDAAPPSRAADFSAWRRTVTTYTGLGRKQALHSVMSTTKIAAPLRGEIIHIRFSSDGRFLLAQDESGINILTRKPFAPVFRIEADDSGDAQFTPDSTHVVFQTSDLRVESWSVADKSLTDAHDVFIRQGCVQTTLSADGLMLGCLDLQRDLTVVDVASGAELYRTNDFLTADPISALMLLQLLATDAGDLTVGRSKLIEMAFSPDGNYFAAAHHTFGAMNAGVATVDTAVIYNLKTHQAIPLANPVKTLLTGGFTFAALDRVIAVNTGDPAKSAVIALPGGTITQSLTLSAGDVSSPTKGRFLFIAPFQKYAVGVVDLEKQQVVKGSATRGIDIFDDVFVAERGTGELALYSVDGNVLQDTAVLPSDTLAGLRAVEVSPDFRWLAVSESSRGAVWDIAANRLVTTTRGFRGATFGETGVMVADFPRSGTDARQLMRVDPVARTTSRIADVRDRDLTQDGAFLLVRQPLPPPSLGAPAGMSVTLRDAATSATLWTKAFATDAPSGVSVTSQTGAVVMGWPATSRLARQAIDGDPALKARASAVKPQSTDYFVEVFDARSGNSRGRMIVNTGAGSVAVRRVIAADNWVVVEDIRNREHIFALSTGELKGHVFGGRAVIAPTTNLLCVENGPGRLSIYDLTTLEKRDDFAFDHNVSLTDFNKEGSQLFVLTADHTAYVLKMPIGTPATVIR